VTSTIQVKIVGRFLFAIPKTCDDDQILTAPPGERGGVSGAVIYRWGYIMSVARRILCAAILVLLAGHDVWAADQVGFTSAIRPMADQTLPQSPTVPLNFNAPIFRFARLRTAPQGALEVTFLDHSKLAMGPGSQLVIEQYVYAGPGGTGQQVVRYTQGAFRFISGNIPKDKVHIETPTVTIGIRGTTIRTLVTDDGTTTVGLDHGDAFVTSKQSGQTVFLTPGEKVTIKPSGEMGPVTLGKVEGCP